MLLIDMMQMRVLVEMLLVLRSEEHTSELQSRSDLVCRLLLEKKKYNSLVAVSIILAIRIAIFKHELPVPVRLFLFFFFNDAATTEIYTLSLHDALPIWFIIPVLT